MANVKINQKEYLKKYLSNDDKKKKKKNKSGVKTVKIIDDDVDLKKMRTIDDYEFEIFNATEDAPQIVGIVDERGPVDFSDKSRWKIIADDGQGDISIKERKTNQRDEDDRSTMRGLDPRSKKIKREASKIKDKEKSVEEISNEIKLKTLHKHKSFKRERQGSDSDLSLHRKSPSPSSSEERLHCRKNIKKEKRKEKNEESYNGDFNPVGSKKSKSRKRKNSSDSDLSLPRKSEGKSTIKIYDSDLSPPRKSGNGKSKNTNKKYDSDLSPPRKSEWKSTSKSYDSDLSPPRKSRNGKSKNINKKYDSDSSSPRKSEGKSRSKNVDSDLSPPRKSSDGKSKNSNKNSDSDLSPLRTWRERKSQFKNKKYYSGLIDSDASPPRRDSRNKYEKASNSRKNRKNGAESDQDLSPPRIRKNSKSPIRSRKEDRRYDKRLKHIEYSNETQKNKRDFEEDSIATRNRKISQSPSRRLKKSRWNRESKSKSPEISKDSRMKKTLDGKTAGLQDAKALREETAAHKKREAEIFKKLSNEVSGAGSSVVIRDRKTGRRRDLQAEAAIEREKEERQREINEQYAKWGKGLKQMEDREEKLKDDLREMSKPLARYKDDEDLSMMQRNKFHEDDPMLLFGKDKLIEQGVIKIGSKPEISGPPNRYGLRPGERWDGVDRSNGYEKKWFEAQNARKATSNEAYKWSTTDM